MKDNRTILTRVILVTVMAALALMPLVACAPKEEVTPPTEEEVEMVGPPITLSLSHQWPQDPEDYVIQTNIRFADEVYKRSGGAIKIIFYPAQSLCKAKEQFKAMRDGTIDMSSYPVIYAAGEIPELNVVFSPWGLGTHDKYYSMKGSELWDFLEGKMNDVGVKSLCWIQISGGMASKGKLIREPADLAGTMFRSAGKTNEWFIEACGAGIVHMASSETYIAMQRGTIDAMLTSSSSYGAYKLWEVSDYYLSPEDYSFYFVTEPIQISMLTWNKLTPEQQKIMIEVGRELETFALEGAKHEDARVAKQFAEYGCTVEKMTAENYEKFRAAADKYALPKFIETVPSGKWMADIVAELSK